MPLAEIFEAVAGPDAPVEFRAYDGSVSGTPGSDVRITVRSPIAVSYLAQAPGALGLARAYVSGHLDVDGDMFTALSRLSKAQEMHIGLNEKIRLLRALGGHKSLYSTSFYDEEEFRRRYNGEAYDKLKAAYDGGGRLLGLYDKCVRGR